MELLDWCINIWFENVELCWGWKAPSMMDKDLRAMTSQVQLKEFTDGLEWWLDYSQPHPVVKNNMQIAHPIPYQLAVCEQISVWWFCRLQILTCPSHLSSPAIVASYLVTPVIDKPTNDQIELIFERGFWVNYCDSQFVWDFPPHFLLRSQNLLSLHCV